ncbi:MAG: hypothetical protein AB4352_25785 [Hormoscilla sp.]
MGDSLASSVPTRSRTAGSRNSKINPVSQQECDRPLSARGVVKTR